MNIFQRLYCANTLSPDLQKSACARSAKGVPNIVTLDHVHDKIVPIWLINDFKSQVRLNQRDLEIRFESRISPEGRGRRADRRGRDPEHPPSADSADCDLSSAEI